MKINEKLNEIFNLQEEEIKNIPTPVVVSNSEDKKEDDFDLARNTMRDLIYKNDSVLQDLVDLARNSESARAYEVAGQLIKTQSDIAKDLMSLHKQKKDVDGDSGDQHIKTQNNIVFAGSTSDLMKIISAEKAKTIDTK